MIDLFHSWDDDGSGDVTLAEFQRALQAMGMTPAPYQVALYLRYIALYLPYIALYLRCISLYLPYISRYLPYISRVSRTFS